MRSRFKAALAAVVLACLGGTSQADEYQTVIKPLERPDPATVKVPALPLTIGPKERIDADSYFYFHKDGVSYETAFADLEQCRLYAGSARQFTLPPKFVALGTNVITREFDRTDHMQWYYQQYGMVGGMTASIMAAIIVPMVDEDNRNATMRRCMGYKGYQRYGLSSKAYKQIDSDSPAEKTARLALLASGPKPQTAEAGL